MKPHFSFQNCLQAKSPSTVAPTMRERERGGGGGIIVTASRPMVVLSFGIRATLPWNFYRVGSPTEGTISTARALRHTSWPLEALKAMTQARPLVPMITRPDASSTGADSSAGVIGTVHFWVPLGSSAHSPKAGTPNVR